MSRSSQQNPFELLAACRDGMLPDGVARRIRALGSDAAPTLMHIIESPNPGPARDSYTRVHAHAIRLLIELRDRETYPWLLELLLRTEHDPDRNFWRWSACTRHIPVLGTPMLDCAFEFLRDHAECESVLSHLLVCFDGDDPRVEALLLRLLEQDPAEIGDMVSSEWSRCWISVRIKALELLRPLADAVDGLDIAHRLAVVNGAIPAHLREKIEAWQRLRLEEEPDWHRLVSFGAAREDGTIEARAVHTINVDEASCDCGSGKTWRRCSCGRSVLVQ
jgi:hypothetical protein